MSRTRTIASVVIVAACSAAYVLTTGGCLVNAPAWPERDGARTLKRRGYEQASIDRVVQGRDLNEELCDKLEALEDPDVLFLLARNPGLSAERMRELARHPDDYVRSGLAHNPSLPADVVATLLNDSSHTVWVGLAANPGLDVATLLALKEDKQLDWSWFAMNPACPEKIIDRIRESGDPSGLYWLQRTQSSLRGWPIEKSI